MGTVKVTVNNEAYSIACRDGQEERLERLALRLQARIEALAGQFSHADDTHLLILAALMLMDEAEQRQKQDDLAQHASEEIAKLKQRIDSIIQKIPS